MSGRGRVCFYSENIYPLFASGEVEFAGGAEVQVARLARGLAPLGFDVSVVTCDFGQAPRVEIDGVTILRAFDPRAGWPVLRFFHPRLSRAVGALGAADAEVYYVCAAGFPAGLAYDVARARRAAFVLAAASDYDVIRSLPRIHNPRDRWWYRRALRGADAILAQTEYQRERFRAEFRLASDVLPNVVDIPDAAVDAGQDGAVIWVGTYKDIKRPEWFVRLARRIPERRFVMVGVVPPPPLTHEVWDATRAAARECPNLEVRGFQTREALAALQRDASLVVHTSPVEGFSNVMLEAWARALPTVSAVDPDGVVAAQGLGAVAIDEDALWRETKRLMDDAGARRAAGARARDFARRRHGPEVVFERLAARLDTVLAAVRRRRASA